MQLLVKSDLILASEDERAAIYGYEIGASYFLHLPCEREQLRKALIRCRENRIKALDKLSILTVSSQYKKLEICQYQIIHIERLNRKLYIHGTNENAPVITTYESMESICSRLNDSMFLRVQRGIIVNMHYIRRFDGKDFLLSNNVAVSVSRKNQKEILQKFFSFIY